MMLRFIVAVFLVVASGAWLMANAAAAHAQDVRAVCARAGNDDRVGPIPAALVPQTRQLFGFSPDTRDAFVQKSTSFRCMAGKVWLCNYGANLVCGKDNASSKSKGASEFCKENPGSDVVPMAATGHDTIYEWKCVENEARIVRQIAIVDPRGFLAGNWKQLE